ncbi:MAG: single-stranded DNA-binding protein [Bacilli bacterium]|nr:single-stranded DNA-binding protein [Bacilli bacterium]
MLNQVVLVGRLVRDAVVNKTEKGKSVSKITLAIPRSFKNYDGVYETDFIDCILWDHVASNTATYCKKGDIVGIKGRVQSRVISSDDDKKYVIEVIAEKVTFLSNRKDNEDNNQE